MGINNYLCWPKHVIVGAGSVKTLAGEIKALGKSRVIVVTDEGLKDLDMVTNLVNSLKEEGFSVEFDGSVGSNPTDQMVMEMVAVMQSAEPDVIVAIGGGSALDAAKAANVVFTNGGDVHDYSAAIGGGEKIVKPLLPLIAIPTTAGTASEVSWASVITNTENHQKMMMLSPIIIPTISMLDPELTVSLPPFITACTGVDALTHNIECYVSNVGFEPANGMALEGIKMISNSLRTAVLNGQNLKVREEMLVASMIGGLAPSHNGLGLVHAMAHRLKIAHGLANALLLPVVMRYNITACPQKFADIAGAMGVDVRRYSLREAAEKGVEEIESLCREIGIPQYLDDVGVTKEMVPDMAENALLDPVIFNNPRTITKEEVEKLYYKAMR